MILSAHSTKYDAVILTSGFPPPAVTNTVVWHTVGDKVAFVHAMQANVVLMRGRCGGQVSIRY